MFAFGACGQGRLASPRHLGDMGAANTGGGVPPPEVLVRMFMMLMVCYSGLPRVREMLNCVGANRDDKWLCDSMPWPHEARARAEGCVQPPPRRSGRWPHTSRGARRQCGRGCSFDLGCTNCLEWIRRAADAAGVGDLNISTHSLRRSGPPKLRRSGASELRPMRLPPPSLKGDQMALHFAEHTSALPNEFAGRPL